MFAQSQSVTMNLWVKLASALNNVGDVLYVAILDLHRMF